MELDRKPEFFAEAATVRLDVGERLAAVDLRLALAEQIEIGAVQDNDDRMHAIFPNDAKPTPEGPSLTRRGGPCMPLFDSALMAEGRGRTASAPAHCVAPKPSFGRSPPCAR